MLTHEELKAKPHNEVLKWLQSHCVYQTAY